MLLCHDLSDPAQTVLPTLTDSRGILTRDIKRNARGSQIDAHPVNNPTGFLAWLQLLAAVSIPSNISAAAGRPEHVGAMENARRAAMGTTTAPERKWLAHDRFETMR